MLSSASDELELVDANESLSPSLSTVSPCLTSRFKEAVSSKGVVGTASSSVSKAGLLGAGVQTTPVAVGGPSAPPF